MSPIVNLQLVVKCKKRSFHSFKVEVVLLRYIVFYCELGCDTSEPHVSYISRACSSLVRQPYYAPNRFILKISGLEPILASEKGRLDGRTFYIDEYTLIFLFSHCIRCTQKRDCWESVRFASESLFSQVLHCVWASGTDVVILYVQFLAYISPLA